MVSILSQIMEDAIVKLFFFYRFKLIFELLSCLVLSMVETEHDLEIIFCTCYIEI